MDEFLRTKKSWYEQGYSKKQALQYKIFTNEGLSEDVLARWEKEYKKDYPNWTAGIWDGGSDEDGAGMDCYQSYSSTHRRKNPLSLVISFSIELNQTSLNAEEMINFIVFLLQSTDGCTYSCVESGGYSFSEIIPKEKGYDEVYKKVFPDRISCGWMLFIPAIILPNLVPSAARVVPVLKDRNPIGTIVVSTEEIFDGNNKEHIEKANDIEIRLVDLGLLPLMTEL
ncbi:immunity 52 family protein [Leclercia adecarboxylata ATCC 23216 = NBRC 102595]|nr:immunity 52 family protein [Leclercia adecarboxylata ATCC 23216 = NBRC 102595]